MRCELTDLETESCMHCKVQTQEIRWFQAAYDGTCAHPACCQPIHAGERIHQLTTGEYEHAVCARRNR